DDQSRRDGAPGARGLGRPRHAEGRRLLPRRAGSGRNDTLPRLAARLPPAHPRPTLRRAGMTEGRVVHLPRRGVRRPASLLALVALLLSGALTVSAPSTASAQTGGPDAEWAFAAMGIFADPRVQLGLALQMDSEDAGAAG